MEHKQNIQHKHNNNYSAEDQQSQHCQHRQQGQQIYWGFLSKLSHSVSVIHNILTFCGVLFGTP